MSQQEYEALQPGDIVRHAAGDEWIVSQRAFNGTVVLVQTGVIVAPEQWEVVKTKGDN